MSELLAKYKKRMLELKPRITARDRKDAETQYIITKGTLSQYINCSDTATSVDVYYDLIPFFSKRIAERELLVADI